MPLTRAQAIALAVLLMRRRHKRHRVWVQPELRRDRREAVGSYTQRFLVYKKEAEEGNETNFRNYVRMGLNEFTILLLKRSIRTPISPQERLVITLRYLATGRSFRDLQTDFHVHNSTISSIVREVCSLIYNELHTKYLIFPTSQDEWTEIAEGFWNRWNVPNTLGSIDGKHVHLRAPAKSGSLYYNYKGTFSTVLLAVSDYRYKILYAKFGSYGHNSDAGIFDRTDFRQKMREESLNLPPPRCLPSTDVSVPYYFIGDGAFPLLINLQKPISKRNLTDEERIFNYRISRGRRVIENVFGILAAKWRVLQKPIETSVQTADQIIKALVVLHNFLIEEAVTSQSPARLADPDDNDTETWRSMVDVPLSTPSNMRTTRNNNPVHDAKVVRNHLIRFFNNEGAVEWQDSRI
ncbi:DDE Tnp4 domain-containing protein [Aphelenchoides besseyi]|nr:DDE Tnp4 domain-containing protein [Aphelenchoides besseyi]